VNWEIKGGNCNAKDQNTVEGQSLSALAVQPTAQAADISENFDTFRVYRKYLEYIKYRNI
jgi:hypothetical protein